MLENIFFKNRNVAEIGEKIEISRDVVYYQRYSAYLRERKMGVSFVEVWGVKIGNYLVITFLPLASLRKFQNKEVLFFIRILFWCALLYVLW